MLEVVALASNGFSEIERIVYRLIERARREAPNARNVGISTAGAVNCRGVLVSADHFEGYGNVAWDDLLRRRFPELLSVVAVNDGRAAAWAEYNADPDGMASHIHVVVGTGVGGGMVSEGRLLAGDGGGAGYIGHTKVTDRPTVTCGCGRQGCVETLAAAPAIVRQWNCNCGGAGGRVATSLEGVTREAKAGEPEAIKAFRQAGWWLGRGLGNAMNLFNPGMVTVGGGVVLASESIEAGGDGGPFLEGVAGGMREATHERILVGSELRMSVFGNDGGMIGAALLSQAAAASHRRPKSGEENL